MRAVQLTGHGGPDKLEYRDDVPTPAPAPGEVRIRVGAASINNTDLWTREGAYGSASDPASTAGWKREPLTFPRIQGADVVGRIDRIGPAVPQSRIDQRVLVDPMLYTGDERDLVTTDYLGSERDGGFAEYVTVPASNAHPVDSPLTDAQLATFPTAYTTAMRMLDRAALRPDESIVVTGAGGGVGSALIQLATLRGAHVTAITSATKRDRARELGAVATVDRDTENLVTATQRATGRPIDVVADLVAGTHFSSLLRMLAPLGRYVVAGGIAGPVVETDLRTVYLRQIQLIGSSFGTHENFAQLVDHITADELTPQLARSYPLHELRQAQQDFQAKHFTGKLVITPETTS